MKTREALLNVTELYRSSFMFASIGVAIVSPIGKFLRVNPVFCKLLGYSEAELMDMTFNEVTLGEDKEIGSGLMKQLLSGRIKTAGFEKRYIHKDGHVLWVSISTAAIHDQQKKVEYFVSYVQDISAQMLIEEQLRQRSRAVEASPASIVVTDINGDIEYVNPKFTFLTGYTFDEVVGKNPRVIQSGETPREEYKKLWMTILAGKEWRGEFHNKKKNGELYYESASISPILDENGKITHFIAVKEDITDRKHDQQRILEALDFNQTILDSSPIGILIYNSAGDCISANKAAGMVLGTDPEILLKQNFHTIDSWKKSGLYEAALQAKQTSRPVTIQAHFTSTFGRELWLDATYVSFRTGDESNLLLMFEDDSERAIAEEKLEFSNEKLGQLVRDLERSNMNSDLLRQMSDLLQVCAGIQEAFEVIEQFAPKIFLDISGALFVAAENQNTMESVTLWGKDLATELIFASEDCWSLRRGQVHMIKPSLPGLKCRHMNTSFTGSYLDIPLVASGETLGLLHLEYYSAEETDKINQELAQIFANNVSLSLSNIKLRETLHNQSINDPLTGLFNRRYMEETLDRELLRARRKNNHIGLIMLDIDYFKNFNDTYGHASGDLVLTSMASLLKSQVRSEDIICRLGGEEFLVILPDAGQEITRQRAESIRLDVQSLNLEYDGQSLGSVTVSQGVAVFPENGSIREVLLQKADEALYLAKNNGRNRVEVVADLLA